MKGIKTYEINKLDLMIVEAYYELDEERRQTARDFITYLFQRQEEENKARQ